MNACGIKLDRYDEMSVLTLHKRYIQDMQILSEHFLIRLNPIELRLFTAFIIMFKCKFTRIKYINRRLACIEVHLKEIFVDRFTTF